MKTCLLTLGLLLLCCSGKLAAQTPSEPYAAEWTILDSLIQYGLPQSAQQRAQQIYEQARAKKQPVQQLKAQLYLIYALQNGNRSDSPQRAIRIAEREARSTPAPFSNIWHSYAGELYWNYYRNYRWQIRERSAQTAIDSSADVTEWDASRLLSTIARHYRASLAGAGELFATDLKPFQPLLLKGTNTEGLRPTLYDLLAFRALAFFEAGEQGLTRPADVFTISSPRYFGSTADFLDLNIETTDSTSSEAQALRIYQQLLLLHDRDNDPRAIIDAELHRLEFVYNHAALEDKDALYEKALLGLAERKKGFDGAAEALYRAQQLRYDREDVYGNGERELNQPSRLPQIRKDLETIIRDYPKSEGAAHAAELLRTLTAKSLSLQAEEVVLPDEPSKVLVTYRNVDQAFFRLIRVQGTLAQKLQRSQYDSASRQQLGRLPLAAEWSVSLPGAGDYRQHRTEIKVDALPLGTYVLVAASGQDWQSDSVATQLVAFQVSRLGLVRLSGGNGTHDGIVADRKTGAPVPGATIRLERTEYNSKTRKSERKFYITRTGPDGSFDVRSSHYSERTMVIHEGDTLRSAAYTDYEQPATGAEPAADTTVWFFTDRAIYRPGQRVYFKGVAFTSNGKPGGNNVIPGYRSAVLLTDANDVTIDSVAVTANDFGSFHGSFVLPAGTLTGSWTLEDEDGKGEVGIQVEEYKRPRFEVVFDTLKASYGLNQYVSTTGTARAFSGANIDGATVRYKVTRRANYPWFVRGPGKRFPYAPPQEIASGTAATTADGRFAISFTTVPAVPADSNAVFNYEIEADITDGAGETRSGQLTLRAGYRNLLIESSLSGTASLREVDSFTVNTTNLNGNFLPADMTVTVESLTAPAAPLRTRLWEAPDQFVMDSVTFKGFFPNDEYRNESNPEHWPRQQVFSATKRSRQSGAFGLPRAAFARNGWYRMVLSGRDSSGARVQQERFVQLEDASLPPAVNAGPLTLSTEKEAVTASEKVVAMLSTGFANANVFRMLKSKSTESLSTTVLKSGTRGRWEFAYPSETDQAVQLLAWTMKDNRVYQASAEVVLKAAENNLDIAWASHRDKLQPGATETWTLTVNGAGKDKVAAELAATLYDASLDQFVSHSWGRSTMATFEYRARIQLQPMLFALASGSEWQSRYTSYAGSTVRSYTQLMSAVWSAHEYYGRFGRGKTVVLQSMEGAFKRKTEAGSVQFTPPAPMAGSAEIQTVAGIANGMEPGNTWSWSDQRLDFNVEKVLVKGNSNPDGNGQSVSPISPRRNLRETAFFFPDLRTDAEGNVKLEFTMPEALTQWKLLAFAHTKALATGSLAGTVRTQKDLMVVPGIPRFLRQGDAITISAKINNLSPGALAGTARIEILDAATLQPLHTAFRITNLDAPFSVATGASTTASWQLHVPEARYEPVIIRITARSGAFTDGEDNTLPVITNRTLVTETQSLWLNGNGTKSFRFSALENRRGGRDPKDPRAVTPSTAPLERGTGGEVLTVEYTSNPAWLALQALPYLADYPYECAEQTFNRYYANALAAHILAEAPKLKEIFRRWETTDTAAMMSKLELNGELKSALLEETPWVLEAASESETRANLAKLFNASRAASGAAAALRKLKDMQSGDGAFPWFKGGYADRYITQYIATGIARMQQLGVKIPDEGRDITRAAHNYLDKALAADFREATKSPSRSGEQHIGPLQVQYLYLRSLGRDRQKAGAEVSRAVEYYLQQAGQYWHRFNPYLQGMIAMALKKDKGFEKPVATLLQSLRETAIRDEEQGAYWIRPGAGYYWHEAPIEAQALLIECFATVGKDSAMVTGAKRWLLKQKQGQHWESTKATADACYALLLQGADWTRATPQVSIRLGGYTIHSGSEKTEAGTGYFKRRIPREQIEAKMSNVTVEVKGSTASQPSRGAVYYQYFADMDAVKSSSDSSRQRTPLSVKKQFFIARNTKSGTVLEPVSSNSQLQVGDKVTVRIVLTADRDMEYIHLKDSRPACLEPVDVLSGYRWQDGLGYYESTRDASSNFFIDRLRRGTAVFEYNLFVTAKGDFGAGLATAQCLYAPEFSAHSAGARLQVR